MSRRKRAIQTGTILGVLGGLVALGIQVDGYLIERRQKVAQMEFKARLEACELAGGRWYRGDCVEPVP